jgi:hypothetical protein
MSHFLLLETQECVIKSDKHEFDVICALRYSSNTYRVWDKKCIKLYWRHNENDIGKAVIEMFDMNYTTALKISSMFQIKGAPIY